MEKQEVSGIVESNPLLPKQLQADTMVEDFKKYLSVKDIADKFGVTENSGRWLPMIQKRICRKTVGLKLLYCLLGSVKLPLCKKEVMYVIHTCCYSDCALALRVSYVIHHGWAYSRLARHRHYRYCFACSQRPETALIATNLKEGFHNVSLKGF